MIFTVDQGHNKKQTYDGFCMVTCENLSVRPKEAVFMAVVSFEGDIDLYWVENGDFAIEEIQRMYRSEFGREAKIIIMNPMNS